MTFLIFIIFLPILIAILLLLNYFLAPNVNDAEKSSSYECGIITLPGQTRAPFSISFWLVGVLFLLFDIDLALFYPLSVVLPIIGSYSYWIGIIFIGILTVGFIYEYGKGSISIKSI